MNLAASRCIGCQSAWSAPSRPGIGRPGIVLPDADPKAIAERLFWGAFINSGRTCGALKRLYVHDSIYSATCDALVDVAKSVKMGDGMDTTNVLGPIQNERQFKRIVELVDEARASGAAILTGGETARTGLFLSRDARGEHRGGHTPRG